MKANQLKTNSDKVKSSIPVWGTQQTLDQQALHTHTQVPGLKAGQNKHSILQAAFLTKKNATDMLCAYKKAKLSAGASGDWYVFFYYRHPITGAFKRFKERFEMNRIEDLKQRRDFGKEAVAFVNEKLADGFNPFADQKANAADDGLIISRVNTIVEILSKDGSRNAGETYRLMRNRLQKFVESAGYDRVHIKMVDLEFCNIGQEWLRNEKLSAKTINATISHFGLFWDEAFRKKWVTENPWRQVKSIRQRGGHGSDKFAPLTFDELTQIFQYFRDHNMMGFFTFCAFIYYAWARPVEICRLRISDIDLKSNVIFFRTGQTKNSRAAMVQIVPELRKLIDNMDLHQYPDSHYVFGSKEGYNPSPKIRDNNNACETWDLHVHQKLKIEKSMYALKHTGNIDYLINNKGQVDRTWQQMQNRHSSATMTELYCRRLNAYFVDTTKINFRTL